MRLVCESNFTSRRTYHGILQDPKNIAINTTLHTHITYVLSLRDLEYHPQKHHLDTKRVESCSDIDKGGLL